jgi:hypothetical protein
MSNAAMKQTAATIGLLFLAVACSLAPAVAGAGSIRATVDGDQKIVSVSAIERDTHGTDGVVSRTHAGRIEGRQIVLDKLPDQGDFDLRLETADGSISGWNASVPPGDDEPATPLAPDQKRELLDKLATMSRRAFPHEVVVLDIQGNAQHAAILTTSVRRGNIQGAGAVGGWVWRADRYEYENPDGDTWAPLQEQPFYAADRREVSPEQYAQLRITYVAALGGIRLTADKPAVDLGRLVLPKSSSGVHAAAADGRATREFTVKPQPAQWPPIE